MAVLDLLADAPADLGSNEIARRAGMNPSTASRLLATLAHSGLVRRDPDSGRFRLGPRLIALGTAALGRLDIRELARQHLRALVERTGETATLSVPERRAPVTVDYVESSASVLSVARIGRPSVPHATASGKVFLAHGGRAGARPDGALEAYTDRTITDPDELEREVARTARRGWAEAVGERDPELNALAVPVLDARGELEAILGLQGPAGRFDRAAMTSALEPLRAAAHALSVGSPDTTTGGTRWEP